MALEKRPCCGSWPARRPLTLARSAGLLTTTYIDEAERAASVLVLEDGDALAQGKPEEIIASVPGTIKISPERLRGDAARRAWRRAGTWRVWVPPGYDSGRETRAPEVESAPGGGGPPGGDAHGGEGAPGGDGVRRGGAHGAKEIGRTVAPDLQDAVTV